MISNTEIPSFLAKEASLGYLEDNNELVHRSSQKHTEEPSPNAHLEMPLKMILSRSTSFHQNEPNSRVACGTQLV